MDLSRRTLSLLTVLVLLAVLGAGVYLRLRAAGPDPAGAAATPGAADGSGEIALPSAAGELFDPDLPQSVTGAAARRDTLWISVTAAGHAEAFRRAVLTARVDGTVEAVPVRENGRVGAGDLVVRIDSTEYALAVARARSEVLNAEAQFRQLVLFDDEIGDPELRRERERLARARSGLEQAEVAQREAELNLARTRVGAPFPGRVANLRVVPGQFVRAGDELATVVEIDPIKVEVQVLEREIGFLEEGRRASVTFAAFPGEVFSGRVQTLNPVVDPQTSTARVTLHLRNADGRIRPGMYARVSLDARQFPDRILVPRAAILERDRRTMLFVYEEEGGRGRAKWRYVTTGLENDSLVELLADPETSTVEPGEVVLVDGHHYLVHDAPVRLHEAPDGSGADGR